MDKSTIILSRKLNICEFFGKCAFALAEIVCTTPHHTRIEPQWKQHNIRKVHSTVFLSIIVCLSICCFAEGIHARNVYLLYLNIKHSYLFCVLMCYYPCYDHQGESNSMWCSETHKLIENFIFWGGAWLVTLSLLRALMGKLLTMCCHSWTDQFIH